MEKEKVEFTRNSSFCTETVTKYRGAKREKGAGAAAIACSLPSLLSPASKC